MSNIEEMEAQAGYFQETFKKIQDEIGKVIVGQERVIEAVIVALISGTHVLLEGVPGLGKTELVKALSTVMKLEFKRIQFTPDLMPADIVGTTVMSSDDQGRYSFEFRKGPIFTQLLLADEINRATPKTQSALLETMQEASVTASGTTHLLEPPFFVMATQNPIEQEGTYPLPEAQLDRFMFKVKVPFLNRKEMNEVVNRTILKEPVTLTKVADAEIIFKLREIMDNVVIADPVRDFAVRLVLSTHPETEFAPEKVKKYIHWGASPRATQSLLRGARIKALLDGRVHAGTDDIAYFATEVLQHRILLNYDGQAEDINLPELIKEIIQNLPAEAPEGME